MEFQIATNVDKQKNGWTINKRGTTWRNLSDEVKLSFDKQNCVKLISENPTLLKRPIIDLNPRLLLGFDDKVIGDLIAHLR